MIQVFFCTLSPVLMLMLFMSIGFGLRKVNIIPENSSSTLAKLETWVFCPALTFVSLSNSFTVDTLSLHATNIAFSAILLSFSVILGFLLCGFFVKEKSYERNIYRYAIIFANFGYMADPLVEALFGTNVLGTYKMFTLIWTVIIYLWATGTLTPEDKRNKNPLLNLLNAPFIATILGMIVGLTGSVGYIPVFLMDTLNSLKLCMGPVAMLIGGITIANYNFVELLKNKRVYVMTFLRLIVLPIILIASLIGIRALLNDAFMLNISTAPIYLAFFACAMPLGMNTVVFPEAFGGDPKPGASMALISSIFSIVTIPLFYSLLTLILEQPFPLI